MKDLKAMHHVFIPQFPLVPRPAVVLPSLHWHYQLNPYCVTSFHVMFIHVKMQRIRTSTLLGINTTRGMQWFSLEIWRNEGDEADFRHRTWLSYITFAFLAMVLSASACVCARSGRCVFACVLSLTDISSNVVDISRGFEDLIPSVFEELCAALLKTLRETLQQSR